MKNEVSQEIGCRMPKGKCRLCLEKKDLRESHLIPAGVLRLLLDWRVKNPNPVMSTDTIVLQTSKQTTGYVLCFECEDRLSKNGETWTIRQLARTGSFPLWDMLSKQEPFEENAKAEFKAYATTNTEVDMDKLVYFGLSIFWRSAAYDWRNIQGRIETIELGPYREAIRKFLLSVGPFPRDIVIVLSIWPNDGDPLVGVSYPHLAERRKYHVYKLYVPGVEFSLFVGKSIPAGERRLCGYASKGRPIFVSPLATLQASASMVSQYETAKVSQGVMELFAKQRQNDKL